MEQIKHHGLMSRKEVELRKAFLEQVHIIPAGERINRCIQCGTCTGSCPVSYAMDISPRELIALFRAGEMEMIMKSRTIWICASCYACTTRCPSGIKITDIIYALKRTAMEKKYQSQQAQQVQILANLFIQNLMSYGRLHEGTLIRKYYMKTNIKKLFGLIPLGRKMFQKKRIAILPKKIKAYASLSRIIKKAQEIEMREEPALLGYEPDYVGYKALGELKLEPRKGE
ncbi:MAG: 4Fe-4S dicluster domain-containing protein [Bacteroidota bacterium]|nr:4Fe-4S dicluster domain-containing protein [Bacteroidota bacterium]